MKGEKFMKKELYDYEMNLIEKVSHDKFSFKTILNLIRLGGMSKNIG